MLTTIILFLCECLITDLFGRIALLTRKCCATTFVNGLSKQPKLQSRSFECESSSR